MPTRDDLSQKKTTEISAETHRKALEQVTEGYKKDAGSYDVIPLLQAIRGDQIKGREEHKAQYQRIANVLGEQNTALNRLSTDVAGLSIRTATLELEQRRHAATLDRVKEQQDGCVARISHGDDTTEIRDLRQQLHKAVTRRTTPPGGTLRQTPLAPSWWSTHPGKAVLGALAGLLVAATSAITTWVAMSGQAERAPAVQVEPRRGWRDGRVSEQDPETDGGRSTDQKNPPGF